MSHLVGNTEDWFSRIAAYNKQYANNSCADQPVHIKICLLILMDIIWTLAMQKDV